MADLQTVNLDVVTPITEVVREDMQMSIATSYFEDYLNRIRDDLNAINDQLGSGEITNGENLGAGVEVFAGRTSSLLQFRTLTSDDGSVAVVQSANEIDFSVSVNALPDEVVISWAAGVMTMQVEDDSATPQTVMTADADGSLALFADGVNEVSVVDSGLLLVGVTANPGSPADGTIWHRTDSNSLQTQLNAVMQEVATIRRGVFTPTMDFATTGDLSVVYTSQSGEWQRIGMMVFFELLIACTPTFTTSSGLLEIEGLPFTSEAGGPRVQIPLRLSAAGFTWPTGRTSLVGFINDNVTAMNIEVNGSGASAVQLDAGDIASATPFNLRCSGFYVTADA